VGKFVALMGLPITRVEVMAEGADLVALGGAILFAFGRSRDHVPARASIDQ
jgi:hypothetical protein